MFPILNMPKFNICGGTLKNNRAQAGKVNFRGVLENDVVDITSKQSVASDLTVSKPNRDDIKKIQKIEIEAFDKLIPITKDFDSYELEFLDTSVETRVIKKNDKLIGYYRTDDWDDTLYIYALAVPKDLRRTPDSKLARTQMFKDFKQIASEKNMDKIALHADSANPKLMKMYKKLGFNIQPDNSFKYANNHKAVYLVADTKDLKI